MCLTPHRGRGRPRKQASEPAFMDDVLPDASRVASPALHGSSMFKDSFEF